MSDTTFNEEIVVVYNAKEQTAAVTASKSFDALTLHIGASGLFKTVSKTANPGTANFYDRNTAVYDNVFSDYLLMRTILGFFVQNGIKTYKFEPVIDHVEKTVRTSIVFTDMDVFK